MYRWWEATDADWTGDTNGRLFGGWWASRAVVANTDVRRGPLTFPNVVFEPMAASIASTFSLSVWERSQDGAADGVH